MTNKVRITQQYYHTRQFRDECLRQIMPILIEHEKLELQKELQNAKETTDDK
jgi:hypothetical protein